jgi:uncharacterized protein YutD
MYKKIIISLSILFIINCTINKESILKIDLSKSHISIFKNADDSLINKFKQKAITSNFDVLVYEFEDEANCNILGYIKPDLSFGIFDYIVSLDDIGILFQNYINPDTNFECSYFIVSKTSKYRGNLNKIMIKTNK